MITQVEMVSKTLYDSDYNLWVLETVKQLEKRADGQVIKGARGMSWY
jgi:hypothetical protein